jgi:hypothetical protein
MPYAVAVAAITSTFGMHVSGCCRMQSFLIFLCDTLLISYSQHPQAIHFEFDACASGKLRATASGGSSKA